MIRVRRPDRSQPAILEPGVAPFIATPQPDSRLPRRTVF